MNKGTDIRQLERVIDEWQDRLYSLAFFRLGDEGAAQDVVQEAFIRYYRESQQTTISNAKAWLYRTTLNLATDHLRQRPPIRAVPLSAAASEAAESDELYENTSVWNSCLLRCRQNRLKWCACTSPTTCRWQRLPRCSASSATP